MDWRPLDLPGCYCGQLNAISDARGTFNKVFQKSSIEAIFPSFEPKEAYITKSSKGVLRGMHFQLPPHAHSKLVTCLNGKVLDVLLDLRAGPYYGCSISLELSSNMVNTLAIPKGCAHGFLSLEDATTLVYTVDTEHAPTHDTGIAWNSFGFDWPLSAPLLSKRDTSHTRLSEFIPPQNWGTTP